MPNNATPPKVIPIVIPDDREPEERECERRRDPAAAALDAISRVLEERRSAESGFCSAVAGTLEMDCAAGRRALLDSRGG
jgi:hypothetical protein